MANAGSVSPRAPQRARLQRWRVLLGAAAIVAVAWLAYAPMVGAYFRHDDFVLLGIAAEWESDPGELVRGPPGVTPLFNLLFYATYRVSGLESAAAYFAVLISLHAIVSLLVAWLTYQLTGDSCSGWVAGLVFAVLFTHHEAVGWIATGHRMLVGVFVLLAINLWLVRRSGARWPLAFGPLAAMLAPLAKDEGVLICLLGPLVSYFLPLEQRRARRWEAVAWFGLPLLVYVSWRLAFPPSREAIPFGGPDYRFDLRILANLIYCVPQMLVPDLRYTNYRAALEGLLPAPGVRLAIWTATLLIIALFVASVWLLVRGHRLARLSVAWCYVAFLPFAAFSYHYARAPRYLYLPSVGLMLLAGWAIGSMLRRLDAARRPRRGRTLLWGAVAVALMANLLPLRLMERNRLRDSDVRRQVIATVLREIPSPTPGTKIALLGLPQQFTDLAVAVPLWYSQPVSVTVNEPPLEPASECYLFRFDPDNEGRLVRITRPDAAGAPQ